MNVTLADARTLRIASQYHPEIVARLKSIHGAEFDKAQRCWWVPLTQADRLMEVFPKAQFSLDAIDAALCAEARRIRNFHDSLVRLGVRFEVAGGQVVGVGENVSPLLAELVAERSAELLSLVNAQEAPERAQMAQRSNDKAIGPTGRLGPSVAAVGPTPVERGIVNAAQKEPHQYGRRPRRGQSKPTQMDLFRETQS